jgi:hypothetical protein
VKPALATALAISVVCIGWLASACEYARVTRVSSEDTLNDALIRAYRVVNERLPRAATERDYERVVVSDFAAYCGLNGNVTPENDFDRRDIEVSYLSAVRARDDEARKQLVAILPQYISQPFEASIEVTTGVVAVSAIVDPQERPVHAAIRIDSIPRHRLGEVQSMSCGPR